MELCVVKHILSVWGLFILFGCSGCSYSPTFKDCEVSCDTGCPDTFTCGSEGRCRAPGMGGTCATILGDAGDAGLGCVATLQCWNGSAGEQYCALSPDTEFAKSGVVVAALASNDFAFAWQSSGQDGDQLGIEARAVASDFVSACGEIPVNTTTAGVETRPAVVAYPDGRWGVAWEVGSSFVSMTGREMRADGTPLTAETPIAEVTATDGADIQMAPRANGFVLTYTEEYHDAYPNYDRGVVARAFDFTGGPITDFLYVNTYLPANQWKTAVVSLANGGFLVGWTSNAEDGDQGGIYARQYDSTGAAVGGEHRLNTTTAGDQDHVAFAEAGGLVVAVWQSSSAATGYDVVAQVYDPASGALVGGEFVVNATTAGDQTLPKIAALSSGSFLVVWEGVDAGGVGRDVYARVLQGLPALGPGGPEFRINPYTTGDQTAPQIAVAPNGTYLVAWSGAGDQDGAGVFARIFR
jgi:hypothetical protein